MEKVQNDGLAKSIGISNFGVQDMETLMVSAQIKPTVNQILLHPYVYRRQKPILDYAAKNGIIIEAYSALIPITTAPGGPLDKPLNEIAAKFGVTPEQILMAWTKAKGAVVVTTSSKKARLEGYIAAGDITLSPEDIAAIDDAGALGEEK
ncbi:NADP-dependent oxidoreductase domain-containing protein [Suillus clintonianus]|uniref:NADP-dependent oxidoreductase domain-containing protein n=1 Tax=Suillus clintonianus TaxID=1904413 RepID=UPI001B85BE1A|nr:NADP-dependent oxidoreductase domain-containing protein [Suillus clintonianus]KAG2119316.1 NADP-dependent oxidoreductase domain-containing protein [Suillus clintonianus]